MSSSSSSTSLLTVPLPGSENKFLIMKIYVCVWVTQLNPSPPHSRKIFIMKHNFFLFHAWLEWLNKIEYYTKAVFFFTSFSFDIFLKNIISLLPWRQKESEKAMKFMFTAREKRQECEKKIAASFSFFSGFHSILFDKPELPRSFPLKKIHSARERG